MLYQPLCTCRYGDTLSIYDGPSAAYPLMGKYCGHEIPPNLISSSNEVFIYFKTGAGLSNSDYKGFSLQYKSKSSKLVKDFFFFLYLTLNKHMPLTARIKKSKL